MRRRRRTYSARHTACRQAPAANFPRRGLPTPRRYAAGGARPAPCAAAPRTAEDTQAGHGAREHSGRAAGRAAAAAASCSPRPAARGRSTLARRPGRCADAADAPQKSPRRAVRGVRSPCATQSALRCARCGARGAVMRGGARARRRARPARAPPRRDCCSTQPCGGKTCTSTIAAAIRVTRRGACPTRDSMGLASDPRNGPRPRRTLHVGHSRCAWDVFPSYVRGRTTRTIPRAGTLRVALRDRGQSSLRVRACANGSSVARGSSPPPRQRHVR